jgi:hypothetical protein
LNIATIAIMIVPVPEHGLFLRRIRQRPAMDRHKTNPFILSRETEEGKERRDQIRILTIVPQSFRAIEGE